MGTCSGTGGVEARVLIKMRAVLFLALLGLAAADSGRAFHHNEEHQVYHHLMAHYNKHGHPVAHASNNVTVTVVTALRNIVDFDPVKMHATFLLWTQNYWTDPNLTWDPAKFGGLKEIRIPANKVWLPDLIPVHLIEKPQVMGEFDVVVSSDGHVQHFSYMRQKLLCLGGHDDTIHHCGQELRSWTHRGHELDLKPGRRAVEDFYMPNEHWAVVNYGVERKMVARGEKIAHPEIHYTIDIQSKDVAHPEEEEHSGNAQEEHHEEDHHEDAVLLPAEEAEGEHHEEETHEETHEEEHHESEEHHEEATEEHHEGEEEHHEEDKVAEKEVDENEVKTYW